MHQYFDWITLDKKKIDLLEYLPHLHIYGYYIVTEVSYYIGCIHWSDKSLKSSFHSDHFFYKAKSMGGGHKMILFLSLLLLSILKVLFQFWNKIVRLESMPFFHALYDYLRGMVVEPSQIEIFNNHQQVYNLQILTGLSYDEGKIWKWSAL